LRGARERQGIPDEVGKILDLGLLVVVGQEDRVALTLEIFDRPLEIVREVVGRVVSRGSDATL
jgi:hypothetical protein